MNRIHHGDAKGHVPGSAGFQPVLAGILPESETHAFRKACPSCESHANVSGKMPDTAGWKPALPRASFLALLALATTWVCGEDLKLEVVPGLQNARPFGAGGELDADLIKKLGGNIIEGELDAELLNKIGGNNGRIIRKVLVAPFQQVLVNTDAAPELPELPPEPDSAGDQVLELTDGSQLHGTLVSLGKNEVVWKRGDASEPLTFLPGDVRRLVLGKAISAKDAGANATLKFPGGDWLVGAVNTFANGKFTVGLGGGPSVEVDRKFIEWMVFSQANPPDAFEGPRGPAGMAGWEPSIPGSWDYVEDSLVARQSSAIVRKFDVLPERMDIQFTAGDGGDTNRGLTMWLQPEGRTSGYNAGSVYLRFQGSTVSVNSYDGTAMKNQTETFEPEAGKADKASRISRYRILFDRKTGRLQIRVNGTRAAEWMVPPAKELTLGGALSFQPSYWSEDLRWTLSGVKVQPWDGDNLPDGDAEHVGKDIIKPTPVTRKEGAFEGLSAESVKFSGVDYSRKEPIFLRFAKHDAEPPAGAVARVWLAHRGEFDVAGLGFKDGVLKVRTAFAGDMALPVAAVLAVEFPHRLGALAQEAADGGDTLVFKNGDQLKGTLVAAANDQRLKWKLAKGGADVQFENKLLAGVQLAKRGEAKAQAATGSVVARWQNGDWLPGALIALDETKLTMKTELGEKTEISRAGLSALYLGASEETPVWDGASGRELWMAGTSNPNNWSPNRNDKNAGQKPSPWGYFDGAFTLTQAPRNRGSYGPNIGRAFDNLPDKCEVSFDISAARGDASFVGHFFFDDNKAGIMVQSAGDFAYLYDQSPRIAGRMMFGNVQQQIEFGDASGAKDGVRHYSFYCERLTGRFAMAVNGKLVGQLQRKGGDSPKPGRGISIIPQSSGSRVSVANIWVSPWTGVLPPAAEKSKSSAGGGVRGLQIPGLQGKVVEEKPADPKPEPKDEAAPAPPKIDEPARDSVALANGDETGGTVLRATADSVFIECEVGELEIPAKRATVVQFAPTPAPASGGARFRLVGRGAVTVEKFRYENGKAICQSLGTGEFEIPAAKLSEIVFTPGTRSPFEKQPATKGDTALPGGAQILIEGENWNFQGGNIIIRQQIKVR